MVCEGIFKFLELKKIEKGSFKNNEGEVINYDSSYKLKVHELTDRGIQERIFKIPTQNIGLINQLKNVKPYTDIKIRFNIIIYNARVVLNPVSLI